MLIHVAGPGCKKCHQTEEIVKKAISDLNIEARIRYVTDYQDIANLGVLLPPAIVVDGDIVLSGRVPTLDEAKKLLR